MTDERGEPTRRSRQPRSDPEPEATGRAQPVSRQRMRAAARARRRRRARQRLGVLVLLLALAAAAYLVASRAEWGGGDLLGADDPSSSGTDAAPVLLCVTQDGGTRVAVLVRPGEESLLVGLPGDVLVRAPGGFAPLRSFLDAGENREGNFREAAEGIEAILDVLPAARADVEWARLAEVAADHLPAAEGGEAVGSEDLPSDDPTGAKMVVDALLAILAASPSDSVDSLLKDLSLEGDTDAAHAALLSLAPSPAVSGPLPGRLVEGLGFAYFEPDVAGVVALLGGKAPESVVSVEVQNGSGIVGAAQKVSDVIAPLGYTVLPPRNADGFPDVEATQLFAASDVVAEADRLRKLLGKGTVLEQESLPPGTIIIVVGKDLDPAALPSGG